MSRSVSRWRCWQSEVSGLSRILALCGLLALGRALPAAAATVTPPDTPAGHALADWLDAFNSADEARMNAYSDKYQTTTRLGQQIPFRLATGGFDLTAIRESEPRRIEFIVKERASDTRAVGKLTLTATDPPHVDGFVVLAVRPSDAAILGYRIDAHTRDRVIEQSIVKLQEDYVYPERVKKMGEALRQHQKHHDYDAATDGDVFAERVTRDLVEVSHDKHLGLTFSPARLPENMLAPPPAPDPQQGPPRRIDCMFRKVEMLPGNLGYVKFDGFMSVDDCGATAAGAMGFLSNADALIFDLRENHGGDPAMVAFICSYLFAAPTHLNDLFDRVDNTTRQSWTQAYVSGKRFPTVPVFVLTSSQTFSGAEEFTYDLQTQKRATVVGEATGGGAHLLRPERVDDRFFLRMPFARAINPVTKTDWEGAGVQPDVKVAAADALATAQKLANEKIAAARSEGALLRSNRTLP
ncbi:MAG TPA: S41 family peptidase [Steroidobacteraceae bacterium]|nr:S41 family peptidase [Steroidobacteraceae bacterium]